MIPLIRDRTDAAVHVNFKGAKRVSNNLILLKLKRDGLLEESINKVLDSSIWGKAKDQLLKESKDKCAYCETPTAVVAYGDVEHFRPKSTYWWLTYCYENYLVSCVICNQRYKKDHFKIVNAAIASPIVTNASTDVELTNMAATLTVDPVNDLDGMPLQNLINEMNAEYALLVNPYYEDPAEYIAYKPILENNEIVVVPTKDEYKDIVQACDDYFGINRKELLSLRFERYCTYMTFKLALADGGLSLNLNATISNRLNEMKADGAAYAGMIRYLETQPLASLPWNFDIQIS
jgi:hypothetical protein